MDLAKSGGDPLGELVVYESAKRAAASYEAFN